MIKGNGTKARVLSRSVVALFKREPGEDVLGKPVEVFKFICSIPASVKEMSGYRALQYEQLGIVNGLELRIRKPSFSFDRIILSKEKFSKGASYSNGDLNTHREIVAKSFVNYDQVMIGDEVVIIGNMKDA